MTEEEQEAVADRFYMADAWMASQGELAGWLWAHDQAEMANKVTIAALETVQPWPPQMRKDLVSAFFYSRYIRERNVGWKSEVVLAVTG